MHFSLVKLPVATCAVVAVAGLKSDMETDFITVTWKPIEVYLRDRRLAVTMEILFVTSYKSCFDDGLPLSLPREPSLSVDVVSYRYVLTSFIPPQPLVC